MSSHSDDPSGSTAPSAPPFVTSEAVYSLEDGVLERYLRGALRPDELEAATAFFSDPIRARALHNLQLWAEQIPDAKPSEKAQKLAELWKKICDQERPGSPSFVVAAKRAGKASTAFDQVISSKPALGKQTLRTVRQKEGGFSGRTLRAWLRGGVIMAAVGGIAILARVSEEHPNGTHVYATRPDQQAILNLDEGTRVTLAPQTTLRILQLGSQERVVRLERGEAYFEVTHVPERPFIVQSGAATAQVLGTAFLMRRDASDQHVRVAVTDGKVRVMVRARVDTGVTLTSGQIGDVTDSTAHVSTTDDLAPGTEWAPGRVIFRHTPLSAVLQAVGQWYGYQFRCADQTLGARDVTMGVSTRSSAEALAEIEQVLAVNLTVVGDTVTLVPHSARSSHGAPRIRTYDVWTPTREVGR